MFFNIKVFKISQACGIFLITKLFMLNSAMGFYEDIKMRKSIKLSNLPVNSCENGLALSTLMPLEGW